jgi:hypothetical protein
MVAFDVVSAMHAIAPRFRDRLRGRAVWRFVLNRYLYQPVGVFNTNSGLACNVGSVGINANGGRVYPVFVSYTDATWINSVIDFGNQAIHSEVDAANKFLIQHSFTQRVVYVPVDSQFHGHRHCDSDSSYGNRSQAYLNGLLFPNASKTPLRQSFHPDKAGQMAYARAFEAVIPRPRGH